MREAGVLLGILLAAAAGCGGGSSEDPAPASPPVVDSESARLESEGELLRIINVYRVSRGLNALVESPEVSDAARAHSQAMIAGRFIAHGSPESRLGAAGIEASSVGENIAAGYALPRDVLDAWLRSPAHRSNLESDAWTHAGAGYAQDPAPAGDFDHVHFWTLNFVKP
jgi:uncharacterized protein YkwD